ncbi:MAG: M56 family metallopeptidase, partial [Phycisphaerae bacterium]|nr:M56 family metallopeptidase [Phycisphaerae bacterium]
MIEQINNIAGVWWAWMWPMFWQVGLLIAMIGLIDLLIRRRVWPQVRYALWLLVLVKLVLPPSLALPTSLTSALGPLARGVIWHQPLSDQTDMAGIEQSAPAMLPVSIEPTIAIGPETVPVDVAPSNPSAAIAADSVQLIGPTLGWQAYIMLAWLLGVLVLAGWLVVRFWQLRRAHRGKTALADPPQRLKQLLAETANKLRLRRLPQMVLSPTATSPAVFGVLRPVLLIPAEDIQRLSRTEIEHILLHELAHIKRGDLIVHAFNMLLQIIYWFNPLLWLVRRQLQHLRELCCDASVARILREKTTDYKETILETARRMLAKPVGPGMGLLGLFENANRLGARLKWLEKKSWKHRPLRIATILAVITLMCACILPMAKGQAKDKKDDLVMESKFTARLAGGVTVELLGVSELHSKAKHWWRPEGTLLDEPPCERLNKKGVPVKRNEIAYELVARISGLELLKRRSETPERWEIPEARRVGLGKSGIGNDQSGNPLPSLRITTAIVKQDLDRITVRFGIVPGLWQKNLSITAGETSKQKLPDVGIVVKPPYEKDGNAIVTIKVPNQIDSKVAVRVIAILKDGLVNDAPAWSRDGKIAFMSSSDNYEFFGLSLSDVDHFEILTGRYRWIEFRNVSLVPGKKTDVQVVTDSGDEQFNTLVRKLRQAPDDDARLLIAIDLERAGRPEAIPHLTEALKQVSFSHPSAARRIVRNIRNLERKNGLPPKNVFDGMYSQVLRTLDSDPTGRRLYAYDLQKADTVYIDSPEQVQETRENRIRRFVSEANSRADLAMILTPKKRLYALRGTRLAPLQIELKLPNVDWTDVRDEVHQSDLKELVVSYHKLKSKYVAGPAPSSQIHPFEPGDLFAVLLPSGQMAVLQTKQITDEPEGVQLAVYYLDPLLALCRNTGVATAITLSIPSEIQPATQAEELLAAAVELVDADETAGRYTWRVNREAPSRMVYGFHSISDTNKMEFIADAKDGIARKNAKDYALEFRREGPNLHLGVADWFFPPDSGGKGKFWDKTSWPNNSTFKTTYVGRAGNLTNAEYVTLWRGDFIREERVVKSILFSARLASQDDPVRRMLDANDPVQALKPLGISDVSKRPSGPLAFGPVIEKVLNSPDVKMVDNCIDLDTGKTFAFPTQDPFFPQWIETNQIDFAVGDAGRKDRRVTEITFAGIGAALVPAENQSWDILTPSAVQNRMSKVRATTGPRLSAMYRQKFGGEWPQTFMFQTRDSGIGLLQILSLNPQDGALSIRY